MKKKQEKKEKQEIKAINIPPFKMEQIYVKVRSLPGSSLIWGDMPEDAKKAIRDKALGLPEARDKVRTPKDPHKLFKSSMHYTKSGKEGIPAVAFKNSMVRACSAHEICDMTKARGLFFVMGEVIPIIPKKKIRMREDFPKIPRGGRDVRYRGECEEWEAILPIRFNSNIISTEQIVNLVNLAGNTVGVLEWRPISKYSTGNHGMFEVVTKRAGRL